MLQWLGRRESPWWRRRANLSVASSTSKEVKGLLSKQSSEKRHHYYASVLPSWLLNYSGTLRLLTLENYKVLDGSQLLVGRVVIANPLTHEGGLYIPSYVVLTTLINLNGAYIPRS
jgi:hypothetical protein